MAWPYSSFQTGPQKIHHMINKIYFATNQWHSKFYNRISLVYGFLNCELNTKTDVGKQSRKQLQLSTGLNSCRQPALQLSTGPFYCRQTDFDKVYLRVETIQSVDRPILLSISLGVSAVSESVLDLVFQTDLNSDWFYFLYLIRFPS